MSYQDIRLEIEQRVATITLHRPDQLNAYSGLMGEELGQAYRDCDADDDVRAIILTGAGRAFCAGADMSVGEETFASQDANAGFSAAGVEPPAFELRKPVIAAVNGHAVGIGLTLALQCDIRIFATEGKYGVLQVRRGVMPDGYSHWTLPRIAGFAAAADLLLTGRKVMGDEAVSLGIASQSLPADEVLPAAREIARDIAENTAPVSVGVTKKLLWESSNLTPRQVGQMETALHHHIMGKSDAIEGPMAYLERRKPDWKLRLSQDWPDWPSG
jgi:enoyl-CoA hydratase/carnithine racemase